MVCLFLREILISSLFSVYGNLLNIKYRFKRIIQWGFGGILESELVEFRYPNMCLLAGAGRRGFRFYNVGSVLSASSRVSTFSCLSRGPLAISRPSPSFPSITPAYLVFYFAFYVCLFECLPFRFCLTLRCCVSPIIPSPRLFVVFRGQKSGILWLHFSKSILLNI